MTTGSSEWTGLVLSNGRYVVSDKLGEGGMGAVYRATDRNLDAEVVIKAPLRSMLEDPEFAHRFEVEIRSLAKLSHPHIVKVSDVGSWDGLPFAVMQYLPGGNLEDRRPAGPDGPTGILDPQDVPRWLPGVARALDYVHASGYIHRDVKPGNILFDAQGHPFLSDFGVVKVVATSADARSGRSGMTSAGMVIGTPEYMAPELIMGDACDGRVDQYALGVTVFEMLAGRRPFEDDTKTKLLVLHTAKAAPPLTDLCSWVPEPVSRAVLRALAKNPLERYPTCVAMADAVCSVIESEYAGKPERVRVKCPACEKSIRVPPTDFFKLRDAGRSFPCPSCQALVPVSRHSASSRRGSSGAARPPQGTLVESPSGRQATQKLSDASDTAAPLAAARGAGIGRRTVVEPVGHSGGLAGRTVVEPVGRGGAARTVVEPVGHLSGGGGGAVAGRTVIEPVMRPLQAGPVNAAQTMMERRSRSTATVLLGTTPDTVAADLEFAPVETIAEPKLPVAAIYAMAGAGLGVVVVLGLVIRLLNTRTTQTDALALEPKKPADAYSTALNLSPSKAAADVGGAIPRVVLSAIPIPKSSGPGAPPPSAESGTSSSAAKPTAATDTSSVDPEARKKPDLAPLPESSDRGESSRDNAAKSDADRPEANPPRIEDEPVRDEDSLASVPASSRPVSLKSVFEDPAAFFDRIVEIDQLYYVERFDGRTIDLVVCDVGLRGSHGPLVVNLTQKKETLDLDPRLSEQLMRQGSSIRMDRVNESLKVLGIQPNAMAFIDGAGDRLAVLSVRVPKPLDKGAGVARPRVVKLEFLRRLQLKAVFSKHLTKPKLGLEYRVSFVSADGATDGLGNHALWERSERLRIITSKLKTRFDRIVAAIRDSHARAMMEKENNVLLREAMNSLQQQNEQYIRARQQFGTPRR
jgi:serine/threonine protein kinase